MADIAVNLPPSSLFLGVRILAKADALPDDGLGLVRILCRLTLCRACAYRDRCRRAEVGEDLQVLYIPAPLTTGA